MQDCRECRLVPQRMVAPTTGPPIGTVDRVIDPSTFFGEDLGSGGQLQGPPLGTPDTTVDPDRFYRMDSVGICLRTYHVLLTSEVYAAEYETSEVYISEYETSTLYPIEFDDSLAPSTVAPGVYRRTLPGPTYNDDAMGIAMLAPSVSRVTAVRYLDYAYEESLGVAMLAPAVSRRSTVRIYKAEPESLAVAMLPPAVSRRNHPVYTIPEESLAIAMLAPTVFIEFGVDIWEAPTNLSGVFEEE